MTQAEATIYTIHLVLHLLYNASIDLRRGCDPLHGEPWKAGLVEKHVSGT